VQAKLQAMHCTQWTRPASRRYSCIATTQRKR